MYKRFSAAVTLLLLATLIAEAQTFLIKGRLLSGKTAVDYANVVLQNKDSAYVSGVMSDKNGHFFFEGVKGGSYRIVITCIGYEDKHIALNGVNRDTELGVITMDSVAQQLGEVVVMASKVIRTADKQIALPTKYQIKASSNGVDLLRTMQLSRLKVDPINNTVSTSAPGEVQLRINGAKAELYQVKALRPENIQRVEYHDDPGMKYGEGVACVIDYITKRPMSGGDVSLEARNSPFDGWGEDQLQGSLNKGKSQLGGYVWSSYRDLHQWRDNTETFNYVDGTSFTRVEDGEKRPIKENEIYANLFYNYKEGDKWFLNVNFNTSYYYLRNETGSRLYPDNQPDNFVNMLDDSKERQLRPWVDVYFQRNFSKRRSLIFNVVGTYISTNSSRKYTEDKGAEPLTDINSDTDGSKYSVIAEAVYSVGMTKTGTMNFGLSASQAYTENTYTGTVDAVTNMHDGYGRGFVEWKQSLGKFNYSVGSFLSYIWTLQNGDNLRKLMWYPKASASMKINDRSYVRLSAERSYTTPSLSNLSNVEQIIDSLQIRRGNPNLKENYTWQGNLFYEWRKGLFTVDLSLFYMYQNKPVMEATLRENNKFIRTTLNQKSWQKVNPEVQVQVGPLFDIFSINLIAGMNYFDSHGTDYHHYYTNWYYNVDFTAQYKKFTFMLMGCNHQNNFYGETCNYGESILGMMANYRINKVKIGIMTFNPFSNRNSYNRPTVNYNRYAPSRQAMHVVYESARLVAVTFNWDFSFGHKYKGGQKQLNNSDKDSGTMNSGK
jgi:hypothetical protein